MFEFRTLFGRSNIENIVSYLISGIGENEDIIDNYDKKIQQSYECFFSGIEKLYPQADREDNQLFEVVSEFIDTHDNIYFEAGVLIGFQICKGFEDTYNKHVKNDFSALLARLEKGKGGQQKAQKTIGLLEIISEYRMSTALEEAINENADYQKLNEDAQRKINMIDKIGLNREQWDTIDNALTACNERSADYGRMAYLVGFKDAVKFLMEISE
jgi:hypothetical protein